MAGAYSNTVKAAGLSIEELKSQADAEYAQRDYTPGGVAHAQSAMDKFSQLSKMTSDQDLVSQFNLGIIKSNYFIGDNNTDKATQKQIFLSGMDMSDMDMATMMAQITGN